MNKIEKKSFLLSAVDPDISEQLNKDFSCLVDFLDEHGSPEIHNIFKSSQPFKHIGNIIGLREVGKAKRQSDGQAQCSTGLSPTLLSTLSSSSSINNKVENNKECDNLVGENPIEDSTYVTNVLPLDDRYTCVYGPCQSGKTAFIMNIALLHISISCCPVVILVRNATGDAEQLQTRLNHFFHSYKQFLKSKGQKLANPSSLHTYYLGSDKSEIKLKRAFKNNQVIICLANKYQLARLEELIGKVETARFVTIVDEADLIVYGDVSTDFRQSLERAVLPSTGRFYQVSATTFNILFAEEKLVPNNIIKLTPKPIYKGLEKISIQELPPLELVDGKKNVEMTWQVLCPVLQSYNNKNVYMQELTPQYKQDIAQYHPHIGLIKTYHRNLSQLMLAQKIVKEKIGWANAIVYNSEGIIIFTSHPSRTQRFIQDNYGKSAPKYPDYNAIRLKESISFALQCFRDMYLQGVYTPSHIAVISDNLADRSISFCSKDHRWHLTSQWYVPAKKTTVTAMIQSIRLCGNHNDDIPLFLYTQKNACTDLIKGHLNQEEMIGCCMSEKSDMLTVPTILSDTRMSLKKKPKNKYGSINSPILYIDGDDGRDYSVYEQSLKTIQLIDQKEQKANPREQKYIENVHGDWLLICPDKLNENQHSMYRELIDVFANEAEGVGLGKTITKATLQTYFPAKRAEKIKNGTWHWTTDLALEKGKCIRCDEDQPGLLFKQIAGNKGEWLIKYNE